MEDRIMDFDFDTVLREIPFAIERWALMILDYHGMTGNRIPTDVMCQRLRSRLPKTWRDDLDAWPTPIEEYEALKTWVSVRGSRIRDADTSKAKHSVNSMEERFAKFEARLAALGNTAPDEWWPEDGQTDAEWEEGDWEDGSNSQQ